MRRVLSSRLLRSRILWVLVLSLAGLVAFDFTVFHSGLYTQFLNPDGSAGSLESWLAWELQRSKDDPNQIAMIGDSRMAVIPRLANEQATGYTYASLAVAGTSPRSWYYILRAADPLATRYRAILIVIETFEDTDTWEEMSNRDLDLSHLAGRLELGDLMDFPLSFSNPAMQWKAARGILFRGLLVQGDVQDFLANPIARLNYTKEARRYGLAWHYTFVGSDESLAGLEVDWENRKLHIPANAPESAVPGLQRFLVDPLPPQTGLRHEYLVHWLGKIYEHYRDSDTKLIFVRAARAPWIRPDLPPVNPESSIRRLAHHPNVVLLDEHLAEEFETPELFHDEIHLNEPGSRRFTEKVVDAVAEVMGPPL